jgi:hypothetical protein
MNVVITGALIAIGVVLYLILAQLRKISLHQTAALDPQSSQTDEKVLEFAEQLSRMEEKIETIEYNTLSKLEKECRAFERARPLTLEMIRTFKPGDVFQLISQSWHYPSEEPEVDKFEYKHELIDEGKQAKHGCEVNGYRRYLGYGDWEPFHFLTSEKESQTWSCEGTIRKL